MCEYILSTVATVLFSEWGLLVNSGERKTACGGGGAAAAVRRGDGGAAEVTNFRTRKARPGQGTW